MGFAETSHTLDDRVKEATGRHFETEQSAELSGDDRQCDPVEITGENRAREKVCDRSETGEPACDAKHAREDRQHDREL